MLAASNLFTPLFYFLSFCAACGGVRWRGIYGMPVVLFVASFRRSLVVLIPILYLAGRRFPLIKAVDWMWTGVSELAFRLVVSFG